jgi:hypothetical protein
MRGNTFWYRIFNYAQIKYLFVTGWTASSGIIRIWIGFSGGLLWTRWWTFFNRGTEFICVHERLLTFQRYIDWAEDEGSGSEFRLCMLLMPRKSISQAPLLIFTWSWCWCLSIDVRNTKNWRESWLRPPVAYWPNCSVCFRTHAQNCGILTVKSPEAGGLPQEERRNWRILFT